MSDTTSNLPENIQAAISKHESAKQLFLEKKAAYQAVLAKVEKHQKTAQAARGEAEQAGASWRELLRQSDGALSKEINALRQKESESFALAAEFDKIALESELIVKQNGQAAYDAFLEHSKAYELATGLYDELTAQTAIAELLALPQAKALAWHLQKVKKTNYANIVKMFGRDATAQGQKDYDSSATRQTADYVLGLFSGLITEGDSETYDEVRASLSLEPLSPINANQFKPKTPTQAHFERVSKQLAG